MQVELIGATSGVYGSAGFWPQPHVRCRVAPRASTNHHAIAIQVAGRPSYGAQPRRARCASDSCTGALSNMGLRRPRSGVVISSMRRRCLSNFDHGCDDLCRHRPPAKRPAALACAWNGEDCSRTAPINDDCTLCPSAGIAVRVMAMSPEVGRGAPHGQRMVQAGGHSSRNFGQAHPRFPLTRNSACMATLQPTVPDFAQSWRAALEEAAWAINQLFRHSKGGCFKPAQYILQLVQGLVLSPALPFRVSAAHSMRPLRQIAKGLLPTAAK